MTIPLIGYEVHRFFRDRNRVDLNEDDDLILPIPGAPVDVPGDWLYQPISPADLDAIRQPPFQSLGPKQRVYYGFASPITNGYGFSLAEWTQLSRVPAKSTRTVADFWPGTRVPNVTYESYAGYVGDIWRKLPGSSDLNLPTAFIPGVGTPLAEPPGVVPGFGREVGYERPAQRATPGDDGLAPYQVPAVQVVPGRPPVIVPHNQVPPKRGEKERKPRPMTTKKMTDVLSAFTENVDAVHTLWKTLPPEHRSGMYRIRLKDGSYKWVKRWYPRPDQMLRDLYRHWDTIKLTEALDAIARNYIEDRAWAAQSRALNKLARDGYYKRNAAVGLETGGLGQNGLRRAIDGADAYFDKKSGTYRTRPSNSAMASRRKSLAYVRKRERQSRRAMRAEGRRLRRELRRL